MSKLIYSVSEYIDFLEKQKVRLEAECESLVRQAEDWDATYEEDKKDAERHFLAEITEGEIIKTKEVVVEGEKQHFWRGRVPPVTKTVRTITERWLDKPWFKTKNGREMTWEISRIGEKEPFYSEKNVLFVESNLFGGFGQKYQANVDLVIFCRTLSSRTGLSQLYPIFGMPNLEPPPIFYPYHTKKMIRDIEREIETAKCGADQVIVDSNFIDRVASS